MAVSWARTVVLSLEDSEGWVGALGPGLTN